MNLDLNLFANKLKRYRVQFQVSLKDFSEATGIPVNRLESLEKGESEPTGDEILIFADYFKCDFKFFISNETLTTIEQTETLFRKHGDQLTKEDRWAIQEFLFLCECEEFLLSELQEQRSTAFKFKVTGNFYKKHGEEAASALRKYLGYKDKEVSKNIYDDFRKIGFHVFRRRLQNSSISGMCIRHPVAGLCILVNYDEDIYRQRFTVAHEAAHAIFDLTKDKDFIVSFSKWDKNNLVEIRANTFASRYLMPPDFLHSIPEPYNWNIEKVLEWANKLMVNVEPLVYALSECKLISEEKKILLLQGKKKIPPTLKSDPEIPDSLSSISRRRKEKLLQRGLSDYYVSLCFEALIYEKISTGRLAEMLLIHESELIELANLYRVRINYGN